MTPREEIAKRGYLLVRDFLTQERSEELLEIIRQHRVTHKVAKVRRQIRPIPLIYSVIDGHAICAHMPKILDVCKEVDALVEQIFGGELVPLFDLQTRYNINITEPGGSYRWHYDPNLITAILYLNSVGQGETVCHPHYRVKLPRWAPDRMQRWVDAVVQAEPVKRIFSVPLEVKPEPGLLFFFDGVTTLHSVRQVIGREDRVAILVGYDRPNVVPSVRQKLSKYVYTSDDVDVSDPNYKN